MNDYLRLFFSPRGRINRNSYRHGILVVLTINLLLIGGLVSVGGFQHDGWVAATPYLPWAWLACFLTLWFSICLTTKRLRAVGARPRVQAPARLAVSICVLAVVAGGGSATLPALVELLLDAIAVLGLIGCVWDIVLFLRLGFFSPAQPLPSEEDVFS